ncbi:MAG: DUF885 domain-containing protein [Caulobacterales bacterium]|nr:DUF885 domain-containing protein [Caulobacterales bacterium]
MKNYITRRSIIAGASVLPFFGINSFAHEGHKHNEFSFENFLENLTYGRLKDSPEQCTSLNIDPQKVDGAYKDKLADRSVKALKLKQAKLFNEYAEFQKIDINKLNKDDALTLEILKSSAKFAIDLSKVGMGDTTWQASPYVISQLTGIYQSFPDFMDGQHKIKNDEDAKAWLARLENFAIQMGNELSRAKADFKKGIIPPDNIIDTTIKQLLAFITTPVNEIVLVKSLVKKANDAKLDGGKYGLLAAEIVNKRIMPQYENTLKAFKLIKPLANSKPGIMHKPNGLKFYEKALARSTTTNMTPDEVHNLGLKLAKEINLEMDKMLKLIGYSEGSLANRMEKLYSDSKYTYPNTEEGRAKILADINVYIDAMDKQIPQLFEILPKAKVEVKAVPKYIEAGAPNGYYQRPAIDGSRPGYYYINLRDTAGWPKWTLPTLTFHEAAPGHHNQIALAQENKKLPFIRANMMGFTAYSEGWGLYAETIADEIGMYENDIPGRIGYLQAIAFRAARCVVDTGIHAKGWSREKAIDYMYEVTGRFKPQVESEIARYTVWPGQACAYLVGREKILQIREYAMAKLGEKFNKRKFHDLLISQGSVPLNVLENMVKNWVQMQA